MATDSFNNRAQLTSSGNNHNYFRLNALTEAGIGHLDKLPYSLRILLENLLRHEDGQSVSREDIEALAAALNSIASEAAANPELLHSAPHDTPVGRLDETAAARRPKLHWALEAPPD